MLLEERKIMEEANEEFDEDNYFSDLEEENAYMESTQSLNYKEIIRIKKFNVYFYFDFNKNKKFVLPINIESFNVADYHIYDLIKYVVKKINNSNIVVKDNNINYSVSLKDIEEEEENIDFYINNYEIKPFDFWTKKDCPIYSSKDSLKTIEEENISFFSKNPLNVLLMKQF
jgi:hypothetical protein